MIDATLGRLTYLAQGRKHLGETLEPMSTAAGLIAGTGMTGDTYAGELAALNSLVYAYHERLIQTVHECARQLGWQVATYEIAPIARESGDAVAVFITGNSFMPPLREFGHSNAVWNMAEDDGWIWDAYYEGIAARLDELNVYMACPEYDNALYVVDLERFEPWTQDESDDSLEGGWRKR